MGLFATLGPGQPTYSRTSLRQAVGATLQRGLQATEMGSSTLGPGLQPERPSVLMQEVPGHISAGWGAQLIALFRPANRRFPARPAPRAPGHDSQQHGSLGAAGRPHSATPTWE